MLPIDLIWNVCCIFTSNCFTFSLLIIVVLDFSLIWINNLTVEYDSKTIQGINCINIWDIMRWFYNGIWYFIEKKLPLFLIFSFFPLISWLVVFNFVVWKTLIKNIDKAEIHVKNDPPLSYPEIRNRKQSLLRNNNNTK